MWAIINSVCRGSTGKIALGLQQFLLEQGHKVVMCHGRTPNPDTPHYLINRKPEVYFHYLMQKITGQLCHWSRFATWRLVRYLKKNNINGVFLINLHDYYCNDKILFNFFSKYNIRVVYIMADESAVWGNCYYNPGCLEYKNQCVGCPQLKGWQRQLFSEPAHKAYIIKKNVYPTLRAAFVAPEFVIKQANRSPLMHNLNMIVLDEAINVTIARPRDTIELKNKLNIPDNKVILLCVAPNSPGNYTKGVHYFIEAARRLEEDERFVFVHVGWGAGDKSNLPSNYVAIDFVKDQVELSYYYSLGDLFVFPSLFDSMSNACLEALACGTPLLCFDISGMPFLGDKTVMTLVEPKNVDQLVKVIKHTPKKTQEQIDTCRNYALKRYDSRIYYEKLTEIMDSL